MVSFDLSKIRPAEPLKFKKRKNLEIIGSGFQIFETFFTFLAQCDSELTTIWSQWCRGSLKWC